MTEDPSLDLAGLTLAACRALVGQEFVRRNPGGQDLVLRLITAEPVRRDPTADAAADRPFSLLFHGPAAPRLTQGRHDLEHPSRPLPGIFLVPIGDDGEAPCYEAVFA